MAKKRTSDELFYAFVGGVIVCLLSISGITLIVAEDGELNLIPKYALDNACETKHHSFEYSGVSEDGYLICKISEAKPVFLLKPQ